MRSGYAHPEGLHTGRPHDAGSVSEQRKSCQYFCKHLKAPIFIWENCSWWWSCHSKYNTLALNRKPIIFDYPIHQSDGNNVIKVPCPGNSSNQMRYWKWLQRFKVFQLSWKHLILDSEVLPSCAILVFCRALSYLFRSTTLHRSRMHSCEEPSLIPAPNVKRHLLFLTSDSDTQHTFTLVR